MHPATVRTSHKKNAFYWCVWVLLVDCQLFIVMNQERFFSDVSKQRQLLAVQFSQGPKFREFITVKAAGSHGMAYLKKHLLPFLLKLSKYSKGHGDAYVGYGEAGGFVHAHILWMSDSPLDRLRASKLWKKGPECHFSTKSPLLELDDIRSATNYIVDHHSPYFYSQFCPSPKRCSCSYGTRTS